MRKIHAILTRPKNHIFPIISWLIMLVEKTNFSHVVARWYISALDRMTHYEAVGSGVNFTCKDLYEKKHQEVEIYEFSISESDLKEVAAYCHDNAGKKYSKKGILGLLLMRILRLFGIKIANPYRDGEYSQYCVETLMRILRKAGYQVGTDEQIESYGLVECHELLKKLGKRIK